jgi:uncharacterized damage-inducible protein DinB
MFRRLVEHSIWADGLVLASLERAKPLPPRALKYFAHIIAAQHVWLARLEGRPQGVEVWPTLDLTACAGLMAATHETLRKYVDQLGVASLDREVHYRNTAGAEFDSKIGDILTHVMMHSTYHRGQVSLLLRDGEAEPAPTDYIAFCRGAPAARS